MLPLPQKGGGVVFFHPKGEGDKNSNRNGERKRKKDRKKE